MIVVLAGVLAAGGYALYRYRANVVADAKAESAKLVKDIQTELEKHLETHDGAIQEIIKVLGEVKAKL